MICLSLFLSEMLHNLISYWAKRLGKTGLIHSVLLLGEAWHIASCVERVSISVERLDYTAKERLQINDGSMDLEKQAY